MKKVLPFIIVWLYASICFGQYSQTFYRPLGVNPTNSFLQWDLLRRTVSRTNVEGNRPVLPGINGHNLELLQDAVARKFSHVTRGGSLPIARKVLSKTTKSSFPKLRGAMAEAIFLDKNPEWGYVSKPNAPQHDVYAKMPNGGPGIRTAQVKFHISGDASMYARDMIKDYRSGSFLVPDDHVDQLKAYLRAEGDKLQSIGEYDGAKARYRDMNRVKAIGASANEIDKATRRAINEARIVRISPYVSLGIATALLIAPTAINWYYGNIDSMTATYNLAKGGTTIASIILADNALKLWRGGLLRGTIRGNVIIACAALVVDTAWQVYEYNGVLNAVEDPEFFIHLGGGISATACGIAGGYVGMFGGAKAGGVIGAFFGPEAVPVGVAIGSGVGGIVVGTASGFAGYFGGAGGTKWAMKTFFPEMLYKEEINYVTKINNNIAKSIEALMAM